MYQNWSTSMQDDELGKGPSDASQPDAHNMTHSHPNNENPLEPDNRGLSEQESSMRTQLQPDPLGKYVCAHAHTETRIKSV